MLVGGVVVENDVDLEVGWHGLVDRAQEAQKLMMTMARPPLREYSAIE
jgi:hypothetical protein